MKQQKAAKCHLLSSGGWAARSHGPLPPHSLQRLDQHLPHGERLFTYAMRGPQRGGSFFYIVALLVRKPGFGPGTAGLPGSNVTVTVSSHGRRCH